MDLKEMVRTVVISLIALGIATFIFALAYLALNDPLIRWENGFSRAWNTWWNYAGRLSNIVIPVITAVITYLVTTAPRWLRTSQQRRQQ